MALTDQDRESIKLIVLEGIRGAMGEALKQHIDSCPYGKWLGNKRVFFAGVIVGIAVIFVGVISAVKFVLKGA